MLDCCLQPFFTAASVQWRIAQPVVRCALPAAHKCHTRNLGQVHARMLAVEPRAPHPSVALACAIGVPSTAVPPTPVAGQPCCEGKPEATPLAHWLLDVLVRRHGVVAAFPPDEHDSALPPTSRIHALDALRAIGRAEWWAENLYKSSFVALAAYAPNDHVQVYHTDGLDHDDNQWFPSADQYSDNMDSDFFDRFTLSGFSVAIRRAVTAASAAQRLGTQLEAAANGVSPAVLGAMVVPNKTPATHTVDGSVRALLTVTQRHSFRLCDMLAAYNRVLATPLLLPSLPTVDGSLYEVTAAIARKVRSLARMRILKLNVTADTVVFCARLEEDETGGELRAHGYGYDGMDTVRGVPFLCDFDPLHARRVSPNNQNYDEDCAYVVMMLVLLASVRAQHGDAASRVMTNKVVGLSVSGASVPPEELPERFEEDIDITAAARRSHDAASNFCSILRVMLPQHAKDTDKSLQEAYAGLEHDFARAMRTKVVEKWGRDASAARDAWESGVSGRPVFELLVRYLSRSAHADTALFACSPPWAEVALDRERASEVDARLEAVRTARVARTRARQGATR